MLLIHSLLCKIEEMILHTSKSGYENPVSKSYPSDPDMELPGVCHKLKCRFYPSRHICSGYDGSTGSRHWHLIPLQKGEEWETESSHSSTAILNSQEKTMWSLSALAEQKLSHSAIAVFCKDLLCPLFFLTCAVPSRSSPYLPGPHPKWIVMRMPILGTV